MTAEITQEVDLTEAQMTALEARCAQYGINLDEMVDGLNTRMFNGVPAINIKKTGDTQLTFTMLNVPDTVDAQKAFRLVQATFPAA